MHRSTPFIALTAVVTLAVAGCSSSAKKGTPASITPTTSTASSGFPSGTPTPTSSETVTTADITSALLTASDVSSTATAAPSTPGKTPLPCAAAGSKSLEEQVPSTVRAGVDISDDTLKAAVSEEIRLYADTATSTQALSVTTAGLACADANLTADDGSTLAVTIAGPQSIAADLKKDTKLADVDILSAQVWQATSKTDSFDLVAVQIDRSLVLFTFVTEADTDTSKLPSPLAIVQLALEKGNA